MESIYPEEVTIFAAVVLYGVPVAVAVLSYLLGCINGAIATSHLFYHDDVRRHGSGNAGLTNFYRNYGAKCAPMVIAFDMIKAVGAVLLGNYFLGYLLGWGAAGKYFGALFCIIGHMFPVFYGFKGGKGVLVAAGAILAVQPVLLPVLALIFLVCLVPTGMVSLGSITMAAAYPVLTLVYSLMRGLPTRDVVVCTVGAAIMGGMVIWMHRSNIQRIRDGKEYRFGQKHKSN